jgi:hypothetical protein
MEARSQKSDGRWQIRNPNIEIRNKYKSPKAKIQNEENQAPSFGHWDFDI